MDVKLSQIGNQPCTPGLPLALLAPCGNRIAPGPLLPKWHLKERVPAGLSGWTGKPGTGSSCQGKGKRHQEKHQFRSAAKEPIPNPISRKNRKTASHVNPGAFTFLSYLNNSQNRLKFEKKLKNPLLPHSICRNEVGLKTQLP